MHVKVTYFIEIMSSWCYWAEPAWDALKEQYADRVDFGWKVALMNPGDFPASGAQCDWYYRRSGTITRSPYMLNSDWLEPELKGNYAAPNLVAEAGRDFGIGHDRLRRALATAAMRDGVKIGRMAESVRIGAPILGVSEAELQKAAESDAVRARVDASTALFHAHQLHQRPSFLIENSIGDKVVLSGIWTPAPVAAAIDAMLADAAGYATHGAHFGKPPEG